MAGKAPPKEGADQSDYADTPVGWASRWAVEFKAAEKALQQWHAEAEEALKAYIAASRQDDETEKAGGYNVRLNLFSANVQTVRAMLYGKPPMSDVSRRFEDFGDDIGRVGGEMLERMLNSDVDRPSDGFRAALFHALDDRLVPALGMVKMEYVRDEEPGEEVPAQVDEEGNETAPGYTEDPELTHEDVECVYIHWRDFLWSPCRVWHECRWGAVKKPMTRQALETKFGAIAASIPMDSKRGAGASVREELDAANADPWARADVWEIWDKENECVWYYVKGFRQVLVPVDQEANENGSVPDPLEIDGFWPWPEPMFGNTTSGKLVPRPDYHYAKHLYKEVDKLSTRIGLLTDAIRAAGVYDKNATSSIGKLLESTSQNKLYPVDGWAMFAEKGGIKGSIDWLPLDQIVNALSVLREMRTETMSLIFQVTGMSDIMRGQAAEQTTATEQAIKAKFASVRIQTFQDEFARFAGEAQSIKAQIIAKFFDPKTIAERSNIMHTPDAQLAEQAIQFIKGNAWCYRVEVKPESISLTDYAALRQENTEVMAGLAGFFANMMPALQMLGPSGLKFVMEMGQWFLARTKGAGTVETIFEQTIAAYEQAQQQAAMQAQMHPPPPDPKVQAQQVKSQGDLMKTQADAQARAQEIAMEAHANMATEVNKGKVALMVNAAKERNKVLSQLSNIAPARPTEGGT